MSRVIAEPLFGLKVIVRTTLDKQLVEIDFFLIIIIICTFIPTLQHKKYNLPALLITPLYQFLEKQ